ncbi:MAG TPA: heme-binding beta-barrel domain-containing protein [Mycobacteriales bacterium]|nr:heme-binding beta-barrel domain-containing protein [Mycobacteriales bacterium]
MFEIPEGLDPALIPVAWLLGTWSGGGVGSGDVPFTQRLEIAVVPGRPVLSHVSTATGADGAVHTELGFWRPGEGLTEVEFLAADADGFLQIGYGEVDGYKVEIGSDAVLRTPTGGQVAALRTLYGRVEGDLAYARDRAGPDGTWIAHASARLRPS